MEIAVASGKGGTGKTFISSNLSYFLKSKGYSIVAGDADVEAPDLLLALGDAKKVLSKYNFYGCKNPLIDYDVCTGCGLCVDACKYDAIDMVEERPKIDLDKCEGFGVCAVVCPVSAISLSDRLTGEVFVAESFNGIPVTTGDLLIGGSNSGQLVYEIKRVMRNLYPNSNYYVLDSAPGIGCPVISSISGADLLLVVVEPIPQSVSGAKRLIRVAETLNVKWKMIVNKFDLNTTFSKKIADKFDVLGMIPYDVSVVKSYTMMIPLLKYAVSSDAAISLNKLFNRLLEV